jgi:Cu(I)/Ag(I) efflux system membrane fusion protein
MIIKNFVLLNMLFFIFSCETRKPSVSHQNHGQKNETGLFLSDQQIQLGNIVTQAINEKTYGEEVFLTGVLATNDNNRSSISTRVMGRIEKLYFKNEGEHIEKNRPLYTIYSEELNMTSRELQLAIEKKNTFTNETIDLEPIIKATRTKLSLYGLNTKQIQEIEGAKTTKNTFTILSPTSGTITGLEVNEGDYVMEGQTIYQLSDFTTLWAEAQVYSDHNLKVYDNMMATITFPGLPKESVKGKIKIISPELKRNSRINLIRIEVPNTKGDFKPGMQIIVSVQLKTTTGLVLPTNAIIHNNQVTSVWVKAGHNHFESKMVQTGREINDHTEIKSGLTKGDTVVISGSYLLTSEYLFKNGTDPMQGHDMSKMK